MEPASLVVVSSAVAGAFGGAATRWAELVWDVAAKRWLEAETKDDPDAARAKALEQAHAMISQLAVEVARIATRAEDQARFRERVEHSLSDPDFVATLKSSIVLGSRTSDPLKREVLAFAVAERLANDQDTLPSLAAKSAIEVMPKLSGDHIRALALLAVVHVIRPTGIPILDELPPGVEPYHVSSSEAAALEQYPAWIASAIEATLPSEGISELELAHLVSTACIVREHGFTRDVQKVIWPVRRSTSLAATGQLGTRLRNLRLWHGSPFFAVWNDRLESATLTPTGMLIGIAGYNALTSTETPVDWKADHIKSPVHGTNFPVWDGRVPNKEFLASLGKALLDLGERGVAPWRGVFDR